MPDRVVSCRKFDDKNLTVWRHLLHRGRGVEPKRARGSISFDFVRTSFTNGPLCIKQKASYLLCRVYT